ncbi:hypothetical protein E4T50_06320 [Aureobasidium sp. EXF-12298]|nr:hypothetical protein E4T50_06320 [Aureobasidium sp. EXF-12298]KAI4751664.1 hypothetical protein E4T51_15123 [Aureobasidium sp. EXF-12344]KAI4777785.1 hypothetical protein E4T52_07278 [Aureobasidium sp. EXF-3400]
MAERLPMGQDDSTAQSTVGRLRSASVSAATRVINLNPQLGMWKATGTAIAHAPNLTDLRKPATGGDNIIFDENGHSARAANATELEKQYVVRTQQEQVDTVSLEQSTDSKEPRQQTLPHVDPEAKVPWTTAIKHGLQAAGKFILTPTGFFIAVYGLNVVAWGAMLFFLLLKAAPAMDHPDDGDADSSPRKIWIEIDSQILNALFCVTGFGLAPWRFRDLYWCACWRAGWGPDNGRSALKKLAKRNDDWFRMGARPGEEHLEDERLTFSGDHAPPTKPWKLDLVVWLIVLNTLFQVGMAFFMWHWNRIDRPSWGTGTFIGLGCGSSMFAGIISWWEGRKIKLIEGPKVVASDEKQASV